MRTNLNQKLFFGRAYLKFVAASAAYLCVLVLRMNIIFHKSMIAYLAYVYKDLREQVRCGIVFLMNETVIQQEESAVIEASVAKDAEIEAMMKAGVHLGHSKSKSHPSMKPYIYGVRNTIAIIDLLKTKEKLASALEFIHTIAARGGLIMLVGTRPGAHMLISSIAERTGMPSFTERWIGGALTNFKVIRKRVEKMETLEREKATGEFEKYTKKERMHKNEEIVRLNRFFNGLRKLTRMPDAVFITDITHDTTAVQEAKRMGIAVIALADTNSNVTLIDYPIPSNDDALPAVTYMLERIETAIQEGQKTIKS